MALLFRFIGGGPVRILCVVLGAFAFAPPAPAEPVSAPVRAEIDALLAKLETSGCDVQRNGKWHTAADARSHLQRKLAYLEDKSLVRTTEQFIERAASVSSSSGKPYLVRCGQAAPLDSGTWLRQTLRSMRAPGGTDAR